MNEKKSGSGSDLQKVEARPITPEQYEEIPERTRDWFEGAELHVGGEKVQRGRPRSPTRKVPLKLRLDPDVVAAFRATAALRDSASVCRRARERSGRCGLRPAPRAASAHDGACRFRTTSKGVERRVPSEEHVVKGLEELGRAGSVLFIIITR